MPKYQKYSPGLKVFCKIDFSLSLEMSSNFWYLNKHLHHYLNAFFFNFAE